MTKPKTKFVLKFKDPDALYEISGAYADERDDPGFPGEQWRNKFTRFGDYASVELDVESGTFRFLAVGK